DSVIDTYRFERRQLSSKMELSPTVIQHLELFENYRGLEEGSLLNAIDRTKTSIGSRLLRQWLSFPETNIEIIETRQNQISHWMENSFLLKEIRSTLHEVGDLERRLGRLSLSTCNARDLLSLGSSIRAGLQAMAIQHRVFQTSPQDA